MLNAAAENAISGKRKRGVEVAKAKRRIDSIMHEMDVEYSKYGISSTYRHLEIQLRQEIDNGEEKKEEEN